MTNTGIYQWFCLWRWWKMSNSGCVFFFFVCFTSAASKFCQNAVTSTDASLGADVSISTAACVFYSLTCLAYNLATWVPHSWNKLSCSDCVNLHCQSVSKSFCALEFPSTMVYKEMFRTALFCYLWVGGSTICQQARRFSIWVFTHKSKCSGSLFFSVDLVA